MRVSGFGRGAEAVFAGGGSTAALGAGLKTRERRLAEVRAALRDLSAGAAARRLEDVRPELEHLLAE